VHIAHPHLPHDAGQVFSAFGAKLLTLLPFQPREAPWLAEYLHELTTFSNANHVGGPTMKIYNHPLAPNPRRVRIFVAEKGLEIPYEDIDILNGAGRSPEFLRKNPGVVCRYLSSTTAPTWRNQLPSADTLRVFIPNQI
jgi:hypothetical protein